LKNDNPKPKPNQPSLIRIQEDGTFTEEREGNTVALSETKISLKDCLACSGCVTTAETILIESQGTEEVLKQLKDRIVVVTISPQSCASIAARYGMSYTRCFTRLITLFTQLGVKYVLDGTVGDNISLLETGIEFVTKKQKSIREGKLMTMICGACPGWICYAEKTNGDLLPYISTTKSSQQILGYWFKTQFAQLNNIPANELYHVSIMPCFDKKLEASRDGTLIEGNQFREVDCVLASLEIVQLMNDQNIDFESLPEAPLNPKFHNLDEFGHLCGMHGGTSGGYLEFIYRYAAKMIWNIDIDSVQLNTIRNDFYEVSLERNGKVLLKFARANGFRSIQNIVKRIKENKCEYDFIEIMACPGGCSNGGGQVRVDNSKSNRLELKRLLSQVNDIYDQRIMKSPTDTSESMNMFSLLSTDPNILHTSYKPVPKKESNPLSIKW